jgi:rSAM/selenodomain-associated transferase 2
MISVIIPVYNEIQAIPATLHALARQAGDFEVVVADGGSSDGTYEFVSTLPNVHAIRCGKGRGTQMNAGARAARGELLLFLHADTRLPDGALTLLEAVTAARSWEAGAFRHRFSHPHPLLRLVSAGNNLRCRWSRIFLGDQAIFVRAGTFERLGGFPEVPILEDVMFCEKLRGETRAVLLDAAVVTDARRFLEFGIIRTSLRALAILVRHRLGLPVSGKGFREEIR